MRLLILLSIALSSLFASAFSAAKEASNTQKETKSVINEQTTVVKNIKSLYIDEVVTTKKIVFNSAVLIKIKAEDKK